MILLGLYSEEGIASSMEIVEKRIIQLRGCSKMCHASTFLKTGLGRELVAWFGGEREGSDDTAIWLTMRESGQSEFSRPKVLHRSDEPHWNPVLFQMDDKTIWLFFKMGKSIHTWRTYLMESVDGGISWSEARELVPGDEGGRGPVKNKPIRIHSGAILAPASFESDEWWSFVDIYDNRSGGWHKSCEVHIKLRGQRNEVSTDIPVSGQSFHGRGVIQPTLWQDEEEMVHMLIRSSEGTLYKSDSADGGENWCPAYPIGVPNNNSGIDLDKMPDGRIVLVCNPVGEDWGRRTPLELLVSDDNGMTFVKMLALETGRGEYSYPSVIAKEDYLYVTYTYNREAVAYMKLKY